VVGKCVNLGCFQVHPKWEFIMRGLVACVASLTICCFGRPAKAEATIPFTDALEQAAIAVDRLDSILEHGLILGNGDVNALLHSEHGQLQLMLTKNDVWDARLDSKLDPPIPTLKLIKQLGATQPPPGGNASLRATGWANRGSDSYHAHPYPCPRACARLVLGDPTVRLFWRRIRAEGKLNSWQASETGAVMSIEGKAEASNGYALGPLDLNTDELNRLRVKISGTANARFYIDVMDAQMQAVFKTGWLKTPLAAEQQIFDLPPGRDVDRVILYTWTEDGQRAENHFHELAIEGAQASVSLDLTAETIEAPDRPARLDLRRAVAIVSGPSAAEIRALADRNVFLIRSPDIGTLLPTRSADTPESVLGEEEGVRWLIQDLPGDADWPGMSYAVALAARGELQAVAIVTSREAEDPRAVAVRLARTVLANDEAEAIRRHEAVWAEYWARSGVQLDDPFLNATWYRNLYFFRCVSRQGAIAPGLFASLIHDRPAWHGDYHTNYNLQQTFWTALNTNHAELTEPYDRLMGEYLPRARWLCRKIFSFDGAYYPHVIFAYEPSHPERCKSPLGRQYIHHVWGYTLGVSAFTVQPIWWHYKYQPDRELLEKWAYPAVRDVAVFQANFMDACDVDSQGKLVLAPTVSPEHWAWTKDFERNRNGTFDIAMFRYVFEAAIEGAMTLGRDEELVGRWQDALARLPAYPKTGGDSPVVVDVEDAPPITYNIAIPAVPVFPGDVVTWFSPPEEKTLFARSIENCQWNGNNSSIILSVARARLSMPGAMNWMRTELWNRTRPNGTLTLNRLGHGLNNFGHYTEQFAASMAIGELLLQSVDNVIRVFPAWPQERDATFKDLRAQGGFLVSASQVKGRIKELKITSTVGGRLRLLSPWPQLEAICNGEKIAGVTAPDQNGILQLDTRSGDRIEFRVR
jgi:hypothetical protein